MKQHLTHISATHTCAEGSWWERPVPAAELADKDSLSCLVRLQHGTQLKQLFKE